VGAQEEEPHQVVVVADGEQDGGEVSYPFGPFDSEEGGRGRLAPHGGRNLIEDTSPVADLFVGAGRYVVVNSMTVKELGAAFMIV
jgi:hypothetical protein